MGIIGPTAPSGPAGGSLSGTYPNPGIAANKIGNAALAEPVIPAEPAEKAVSTGSTSPAKKICDSFKGDGVIVKIKCIHNFNTTAVTVGIQKETTKVPAKQIFQAKVPGASSEEYNWEAINANEVEITFGAAPAVGTLMFITIIG